MTNRINHQWRLAARPSGAIRDSDFKWTESPVPALGEGQFLARVLYISLDPTNRVWMNASDSYLPALPLGEVMRYAAQLGSITQGQGSYSMEFSHYDQVPGNVQQQIVSKAKVHHDEDE